MIRGWCTIVHRLHWTNFTPFLGIKVWHLLMVIIGRLPSFVVFHHRSCFIIGRLPSQVVFHHRSSSIRGHLPSKGCLQLKVVFHRRSSSIEGRLPSKIVFHRRSSKFLARATEGTSLYVSLCPSVSQLVSAFLFSKQPELLTTWSCYFFWIHNFKKIQKLFTFIKLNRKLSWAWHSSAPNL